MTKFTAVDEDILSLPTEEIISTDKDAFVHNRQTVIQTKQIMVQFLYDPYKSRGSYNRLAYKTSPNTWIKRIRKSILEDHRESFSSTQILCWIINRSKMNRSIIFPSLYFLKNLIVIFFSERTSQMLQFPNFNKISILFSQ